MLHNHLNQHCFLLFQTTWMQTVTFSSVLFMVTVLYRGVWLLHLSAWHRCIVGGGLNISLSLCFKCFTGYNQMNSTWMPDISYMCKMLIIIKKIYQYSESFAKKCWCGIARGAIKIKIMNRTTKASEGRWKTNLEIADYKFGKFLKIKNALKSLSMLKGL